MVQDEIAKYHKELFSSEEALGKVERGYAKVKT